MGKRSERRRGTTVILKGCRSSLSPADSAMSMTRSFPAKQALHAQQLYSGRLCISWLTVNEALLPEYFRHENISIYKQHKLAYRPLDILLYGKIFSCDSVGRPAGIPLSINMEPRVRIRAVLWYWNAIIVRQLNYGRRELVYLESTGIIRSGWNVVLATLLIRHTNWRRWHLILPAQTNLYL